MPPGKSQSVRAILFVAACVLVVGVFAWTAVSGVTELSGRSAADSHYNLLVEGFQRGHLSLNKEAPAELGRLADPYDPVANARYRLGAGLHDMTYYKGKLYLYFGATPALVLFWPWAALTGHYLFHRYAVAIFCSVGFLASAWVLRALWRRYFPEIGVGVVAAGTLALGLATGVPVMQPRAEFWEVAVSCGYALVMLALGAVWLALHDPAKRGWWLAAASLAVGLATGARPFLVLGAAILLVPVVLVWNQPPLAGSRRMPWGLLAAALLPLVLCGIGLMVYNDLRFDSPFEFGQRYQLAGDRQDTGRHFSLDYLWFNFCVYFLEPVRWNRHFPFIGDIATPAVPPGHASVEDPFGALTNIPVLWLALAAPLGWRGRAAGARAVVRGFVAAVALLFATSAAVLCLFYGNCSRYQVEFLPALALLAVIGILGVERALAGRPRWRLAARVAWGLPLAFSVGFNLLAGLDHYALQRSRMGNLLDGAGRLPEAIAQYGVALRIKPACVEAHIGLGDVLRQMGRIPEAIAHCRAALQSRPDDAKAHNNLANALLDAGRISEAIEHYEAALRLTPAEGKIHYNFGVALLKAGRSAEAIAQFEAALRIDPEDAETHYNFGNALFAAERIPEAIEHYEAAVRIRPDFVEAHNNLGNALLRAERTPEAIEQLQTAVRIRPDYAEGYNSLGAALYHAGRIREAITQFAAAVRIKPDYIDARRNLERMVKLLPATDDPQ